MFPPFDADGASLPVKDHKPYQSHQGWFLTTCRASFGATAGNPPTDAGRCFTARLAREASDLHNNDMEKGWSRTTPVRFHFVTL